MGSKVLLVVEHVSKRLKPVGSRVPRNARFEETQLGLPCEAPVHLPRTRERTHPKKWDGKVLLGEEGKELVISRGGEFQGKQCQVSGPDSGAYVEQEKTSYRAVLVTSNKWFHERESRWRWLRGRVLKCYDVTLRWSHFWIMEWLEPRNNVLDRGFVTT